MGRSTGRLRLRPGYFVLGVVGALVLSVLASHTPAQQPAPPAAATATEAPATPPVQPDPTGANTGGAGDVPAKDAKAGPTLTEVADRVGKNKISINIVWTLITGFLVMFMQAGFALVETGLCRAKNSAHTMSMNFMIYPLGMLGFYVCGFAFMFGGVGTGITALGPGTGVLDSMFHFELLAKRSISSVTKASSLAPASMTAAFSHCFCFRWCLWILRRQSPRGRWPNAGNSVHLSFTACASGRLCTRCTAAGSGVAAG